MRLNVGSSQRQLPGFVSLDVRPVGHGVRRGHAGDLSFAADGSVQVLFVNAVFEHVFLAHHLRVLREWRRVLASNGAIVCLGIPDFESIARLYLDRATGIVSERFDLFNVYRYTHGSPEMETVPLWSRWDPAWHVNSGPPATCRSCTRLCSTRSILRDCSKVRG